MTTYPPPPGLSEMDLDTVLRSVAAHAIVYEAHGLNCSCMDSYIRRIRAIVNAQIEGMMTANENYNDKIRRRVSYVIASAIARLR